MRRRRSSKSTSGNGHLLPYNSVMSLRVAGWVRGACREGEDVPVHLKESNLIGTSPEFVPGNIDVVDDLAALYRVCTRVREHRVVERHSLIARRCGAGRHYPGSLLAGIFTRPLSFDGRLAPNVPRAADDLPTRRPAGRTRPKTPRCYRSLLGAGIVFVAIPGRMPASPTGSAHRHHV
jgi:hypothetical protein